MSVHIVDNLTRTAVQWRYCLIGSSLFNHLIIGRNCVDARNEIQVINIETAFYFTGREIFARKYITVISRMIFIISEISSFALRLTDINRMLRRSWQNFLIGPYFIMHAVQCE